MSYDENPNNDFVEVADVKAALSIESTAVAKRKCDLDEMQQITYIKEENHPMPSKKRKGDVIITSNQKKYYIQKFRSGWMREPEFRDWLTPIRGAPDRAFCKVCQVQMHSKLSDIRKHAETRKHKKFLTYPHPSKNMDISTDMGSIVVNIPEVTNKSTPPNHILHSRISTDTLRLWQCCGTEILPHNLMYPIFVIDEGIQPSANFPGIFRYGPEKLCTHLDPLIRDGLSSVFLHCASTKITKSGSCAMAYSSKNPIVLAIKKLRDCFPSLTIACDICLCPFTKHGQCGILLENGTIDVDATIKCISEISLAYTLAGANILVPSCMMDGHVGAIKSALQRTGLANKTSVLSVSAKFASTMAGEFREMNRSIINSNESSSHGYRKQYHLPPGSLGMALNAVERDVAEGADMLMVCPALPYLDVVREIKDKYPTHSLFAYQVSGEYLMLHYGSSADSFDFQSTLQEILISMRRAGVDVIVTYFTPFILQWLKQ